MSSFWRKLQLVSAGLLLLGSMSVAPVMAQTGDDQAAFSISAQGPHFFSGESITLSENLSGDVYVAGGQVTVDGTIDGDLLVAGGQVVINGRVTEDVRAAGGSVTIRGIVSDDVTVAGGNILMESTAQIDGSLVAMGGNVELLGSITGPVWVGSSKTTLAGRFNNDVTIRGEQANVAASASVSGNLKTTLDQAPMVASGATVVGQQAAQLNEENEGDTTRMERSPAAKISWLLTSLAVALVIGGVFLWLAPKLTSELADQVRVAPGSAAGWGFVHLILTPAILGLLILTIVGIPFSLLGFMVYFLSLMVGGWVTAFALGQRVLQLENSSSYTQRMLALAIGLGILKLLGLIPIAGALINFGAMLLGMGAMVMRLKNRRAPVMPETQSAEVLVAEPVAPVSMVKTKKASSSRKAAARKKA